MQICASMELACLKRLGSVVLIFWRNSWPMPPSSDCSLSGLQAHLYHAVVQQ